MKTKITILTVILTIIAVTAFFSCENPISLGSMLDLDGPDVNITSPAPRTSVPSTFDISGTVSDYSGVRNLLIKAFFETNEVARQWRYQNGGWEVSNDYGSTWQSYADAQWTGDSKNASWKITVDMVINGIKKDGEYTFNVQAWDISGASTDISLKAIVLIVDTNPPLVDITYPYLYRTKKAYDNDPDFNKLHIIGDGDDEKQDPAYLGKFITQEFELKWQIDDINEIKSFDLRIYPFDSSLVDDDTDTPLPDINSDTDCIYYYYKDISYANDYIKLNGSVKVPALESDAGTYDGGGRIIHPVIENATQGKTTVKIVITCYDAAGNNNPLQEKTIGYFVYWPKANNPWITFTEGMTDLDMSLNGTAIGGDGSTTDKAVYMVYPGSNIRATAFQAQGVDRVEYALYKCDTISNPGYLNLNTKELVKPTGDEPKDKYSGTKTNATKNTIFSWKVDSPYLTGYYILEATVYSLSGISKKYEELFRVQDITFPKFLGSPSPNAGEPLFKDSTFKFTTDNPEGEFTISGQVDDATRISSLYLVWINPESPGYSAMSQLKFFRDSNYKGWTYPENGDTTKPASSIKVGESVEQYDNELSGYNGKSNANRLWRVDVNDKDRELVDDRWVYNFEQKIKIKELKIDLTKKIDFTNNNDPTARLKSQIFLLRAENPDGKCAIITYAPQGDTIAPIIKITNVKTDNVDAPNNVFIPDEYGVIPKFKTGNKITITGTWTEDSAIKLPLETYFKPNFNLTVNNKVIPVSEIKMTPTAGSASGDWNVTIEVGKSYASAPTTDYLTVADLLDTLVISAKAGDVGGNKTEVGASWLIQSDNLRLMRISSEIDDGTYTIGKQIEIFLEFNKPVILANSSEKPQLILSSSSGDTIRADYKSEQSSQNSRQYFVYTVRTGETTGNGYLNVKGIANNGEDAYKTSPVTTDPQFTDTDYPFTWTSGAGKDLEEVRLTMQSGYDGKTKTGAYYVRTVPTTTNSALDDYKYTLGAGKRIIIDTTPPSVTSITSNTTAGYYKTGDIFMTVTFSKPVTTLKDGDDLPPRLIFDNIVNGSTTAYTSSNTSDVKVTDNKIVFKYSIRGVNISNGDTTNGNAVIVKSFTGIIQDLAGNSLPSNGVSNRPDGSVRPAVDRTLTGVVIETSRPTTPTVKVLTSGTNADATVKNTVDSSDIEGISGSGDKDLKTLYNDNLWLVVSSNQTNDYKLGQLEYTTNNGTSWIPVNNNTIVPLDQIGAYTVQARQVDKAGNISPSSTGIRFTRDPGNLLDRISSTSANGTYTNASGKNQIDITFYFRKSLSFTTPTITVNAKSGNANNSGVHGDGTERTLSGTASGSEVKFTYTVNLYDAIPVTANNPNAYLDVSTINFPTPRDSDNVNVSAFISLPSSTPKLDSNKQFKIQTGLLTNTAPTFILAGATGTSATETADNFHGIRTDDGSYWTTLQIPFVRAITKGDGIIKITQRASDYRLPAVITEAQYNRFKNVNDINKYYIKGTNGFNGTSSDTSTKYVLQYKYNTFRKNVADTLPDQTFIDNFRNAEKITINVNSQAVTITDEDGKVAGETGVKELKYLRIRLTGSNAPQVPGAIYEVTYPAGIVNDSLGNTSLEGSYTNVSLGGVAKPFVRIKKTPDSITTTSNTPSMTQPRLVATQPLTAEARIDSRTPDSTITYSTNSSQTSVSAVNWGSGASSNGNGKDGPDDNASIVGAPGVPATTYTDNAIKIGSDSDTIENVQGYQWRIRAVAKKTGSPDSAETQEIAYRTVITYQIRTGAGNMVGGTAYSLPEAGDQIWIRGGDAIGSSSVPGFPFTWEDDWDNLSGKRAGIRLMSLVSFNGITATNNNNTYTTRNVANNDNQEHRFEAGDKIKIEGRGNTIYTVRVPSNTTITIYNEQNTTQMTGLGSSITIYPQTLLNSLWRLVTWDINTTAYIDFIRGKDDNTDQNVAWQYGPKYLAYQRAGWTSYKDKFPIYPGKHRWCDAGQNNSGKGDINFSGTLFARPDKSVTTGWDSPNSANATATN